MYASPLTLRWISAALLVAWTTVIAQDVTPPAAAASSDQARRVAVAATPECKLPEYPTEARRLAQEGRAVIEYVMSKEGFIVEAKVFRSSGHPLLDQVSMVAVVSCRGVPGSLNGAPLEMRSRVTYVWKLTD
jgi:TonB family protein